MGNYILFGQILDNLSEWLAVKTQYVVDSIVQCNVISRGPCWKTSSINNGHIGKGKYDPNPCSEAKESILTYFQVYIILCIYIVSCPDH